jgi:hypothetical protein
VGGQRRKLEWASQIRDTHMGTVSFFVLFFQGRIGQRERAMEKRRQCFKKLRERDEREMRWVSFIFFLLFRQLIVFPHTVVFVLGI